VGSVFSTGSGGPGLRAGEDSSGGSSIHGSGLGARRRPQCRYCCRKLGVIALEVDQIHILACFWSCVSSCDCWSWVLRHIYTALRRALPYISRWSRSCVYCAYDNVAVRCEVQYQ